MMAREFTDLRNAPKSLGSRALRLKREDSAPRGVRIYYISAPLSPAFHAHAALGIELASFGSAARMSRAAIIRSPRFMR